jgi:hypothetical protein
MIPANAVRLVGGPVNGYAIAFRAPNGATTYAEIGNNHVEPEMVAADILEHMNAWFK